MTQICFKMILVMIWAYIFGNFGFDAWGSLQVPGKPVVRIFHFALLKLFCTCRTREVSGCKTGCRAAEDEGLVARSATPELAKLQTNEANCNSSCSKPPSEA